MAINFTEDETLRVAGAAAMSSRGLLRKSSICSDDQFVLRETLANVI